jgi:hypothetical protein
MADWEKALEEIRTADSAYDGLDLHSFEQCESVCPLHRRTLLRIVDELRAELTKRKAGNMETAALLRNAHCQCDACGEKPYLIEEIRRLRAENTKLLGLVNELREDRDHWKKRAESAEYALGPYLCPKCQKCLSPQELDHTMCRACAEKDMAKRLGAGLLDLPSDWYDECGTCGYQPCLCDQQ